MKKYANRDCMCDCEVKREYTESEMDSFDAEREHKSSQAEVDDDNNEER